MCSSTRRGWGRGTQSARRSLCGIALALALASDISGQTLIEVHGRVREAGSLAALPGATVRSLSSGAIAVVGRSAEYELQLTPGVHVLRAERIGYAPEERELTVGGDALTADFLLSTAPVVQDRPILTAPADNVPLPTPQLPFPRESVVRDRQVVYRPFSPRDGETFEIPLFEDLTITVEPRSIERVGPNHLRWIGRVRPPAGPGDGIVTLVFRDDRLTGTIRLRGRTYHIMPLDNGLHWVIEFDPTRMPLGPLPPIPPPRPPRPPTPPPTFFPERPIRLFPERLAPYRLARSVSQPMCEDLTNLQAGGLPEVRLMVLYSALVQTAVPFILDEIDQLVLEVNATLQESDIPIRVTLAHAEAVTTPDTNLMSGQAHIDKMMDVTDTHLGHVPALRDRHHADATVLLVKNMAQQGQAEPWDVVSLQYAERAYAAVQYGATVPVLAFTHEVGHLLGGQHDRGNGTGNIFWRPYHYNHGYVIPGLGKTTVMANPIANVVRLQMFSSPDHLVGGVPSGVASTEALAADNRRALTNVAGVVSALRLTPVWLSSAGAMAPWAERQITELPISEARFADFDGDGEADAFRVDQTTGTWLWSRSASEAWDTLNGPNMSLAVPLTELAFGDFDADGRADVFRSDVTSGTWYWSPGGSSSWQILNGPDPSLKVAARDLAFGHFDSNATTDVFRSATVAGEWWVSYGGGGAWTTLKSGGDYAISLDQLLLGDFDGDGTTDVLRRAGTSAGWLFSKGGTGNWADRSSEKTETMTELAVGDFDGDGADDVLTANGREWLFSSGAVGAWEVVRESCHDLTQLAFADFDGDGTTDVIRWGIRP